MIRRPARLALVCLGFLATVGMGYRLWLDDSALAAAADRSVGRDHAAEAAMTAAVSLRSALQASVGAGQDAGAGSTRALTHVDAVRSAVAAWQSAVVSTGGSAADTVALMDPLAAAVRRVQAYLSDGQPLLAADVIFTDISAQIDTVALRITAARDTARAAAREEAVSLRRRQAGFAGATVLLWIAISAALVPLPASVVRSAATQDEGASPVGLDLALAPSVDTSVASAPFFPPERPEPVVPPVALQAVAEVCTDLSALADHQALGVALAGVCRLMDATGAIVWLATTGGHSLAPGLVHGYDPTMIQRIGTIPSDGDNLTARAFRDGVAHTAQGAGRAPAALAVPMFGPAGPVGVLSAELRPGARAEAELIALGTIFAAQLATLVLPQPSAPSAETDAPRQAHA